jgi:hypothetical protein
MDRALTDFANSINAGFVREDAALSIIIISDEEDGGGDAFLDDIDPSVHRDDVQVYIDLLGSLKAGSVSNAPVLVSVVVDPSFSTRYQTVAQAFSGVVLDIRSPDWGEQLSQIGSATFGLQRLFRLASPPQPGTVVVEVDGTTLDPSAYTVDEQSRTVVVADTLPAGAVVEITYEAGCE